jgi:hypothetical protein
MSIPILACNVIKAAKGDQDAYNGLIEAMKVNFACGSYSTLPCTCDPKCGPCTELEIDALNQNLADYFAAHPDKK